VRPGDSLALDGVTVRFLAPDSAWTAGLRDANLASTVASVRFGRVRFLLVGDAEEPEERWLLARDREALRADVLKVGHHGSATSTSPEFLATVAPRVALVSVGAGNTYGHPSSDVIRALRAAGAEVLRTDHAGAVVLRTDGTRITAEARGERWPVAERAHATVPIPQ
jgi:competence protein ComEC